MASIRVQDTTHNYTRAVIENLLYAANTYEYFEIEIWDYSMSVYSGQTLRWSEVITDNYAWLDIAGLTPSTGYTFKGFAKQPGGVRNHVGNVSFTTSAESGGGGGTDPDPDPTPTRPSNWSWTTLVSSGSVYSNGGILRANVVSATEWNNFCSRINDFRVYRGLSTYTFTSAGSSQSFTQSMVNEAINAINQMGTVSQGAGPYSTLINLQNALNSIS